MKVIIIDDEPLARAIVKEYLLEHSDIKIAEECNDGFEGMKAIMKHQPDLVFLDIQMPKINGFEMLELIEEPPAIIFTTAFDEFAIKAFETKAIDYLLKPFSQDRFDKAVGKFKEQQNRVESISKIEELNELTKQPEEHQRVVVKTGSEIKILPTFDIYFIEAYDDYVKINTVNDCFLKKKTMSYYEHTLDANIFVRVHRSFIIQIQYINKIEPSGKDSHVALLKNGEKIPLSKNGYTKLKSVLGI